MMADLSVIILVVLAYLGFLLDYTFINFMALSTASCRELGGFIDRKKKGRITIPLIYAFGIVAARARYNPT